MNIKNSNGPLSIFLIFLRLGLTAFGGPVAHLGYFREEFVHRRRWLSDAGYANLVALCQFLPGPASSQVGLAIGLQQAGYRGALAAWSGFTLPSALLLILFAIGLGKFGNALPAGLLQGLKIVAVAVVAQAVWGMAKSLCPDGLRRTLALAASVALLAWPSAWSQIAIILLAGLIGLSRSCSMTGAPAENLSAGMAQRTGALWLAFFFALLVALPILARLFPVHELALVDAFYRAGALVFGGAHVVLPLLQTEIVGYGWVDREIFLAGYGAAQAVPGPLFTFAAFLGAAAIPSPNGWLGGLLCLLAIFLPAFLLLAGALPFWDRLRSNSRARAALAGINAAVVGILLAALYDPLWSSTIHTLPDLLLALVAFTALPLGKQAPWRIVAACALSGWLLG